MCSQQFQTAVVVVVTTYTNYSNTHSARSLMTQITVFLFPAVCTIPVKVRKIDECNTATLSRLKNKHREPTALPLSGQCTGRRLVASWWQQRSARSAHNSRSKPPARDSTAISINPLRFPSGSKAVSQRCSTTSKSTLLWRVAVKRGALGSAICHAAEDFSWNSLKDAIKAGLIGMASALIGSLEVKRNRVASAALIISAVNCLALTVMYGWRSTLVYYSPSACVCHTGHNTC